MELLWTSPLFVVNSVYVCYVLLVIQDTLLLFKSFYFRFKIGEWNHFTNHKLLQKKLFLLEQFLIVRQINFIVIEKHRSQNFWVYCHDISEIAFLSFSSFFSNAPSWEIKTKTFNSFRTIIDKNDILTFFLLSPTVRQENERLIQDSMIRARMAANFTEPPPITTTTSSPNHHSTLKVLQGNFVP